MGLPEGNQAIWTPSPVQGLTGDPGELTPVLGLASDCSAQSDCRGCWRNSTRVCRPGNLLEEAFSTAPILHHPDPQVPFVVEVDASTTGVGAVLSQYHGEPPRLHTPFTKYRALDTQAARGLSRSFKLGTGAPVWPRMSSGTSAAAQSVPCRNPLAISHLANWFPCLFPKDPGHTSE